MMCQVMSTLLGAGFTVDELGPEKMSKLADYLESNMIDGHGTVGFGKRYPDTLSRANLVDRR